MYVYIHVHVLNIHVHVQNTYIVHVCDLGCENELFDSLLSLFNHFVDQTLHLEDITRNGHLLGGFTQFAIKHKLIVVSSVLLHVHV